MFCRYIINRCRKNRAYPLMMKQLVFTSVEKENLQKQKKQRKKAKGGKKERKKGTKNSPKAKELPPTFKLLPEINKFPALEAIHYPHLFWSNN